MKKYRWLDRKRTDPELPFEPPMWFGNESNGEYFYEATAHDRKVRKLVQRRADENAARVGMDRRQFMASAMGMCTTLLVLNEVAGCSSDGSPNARGGPDASGGGLGGGGMAGAGGGSGPGGGGMGGTMGPDSGRDARFCVPPEAQFDEDVACDVISGNEFIFDVQTHHFREEDLSRFPAYVQSFGSAFFQSTDETAYINDLFLDSDTTISVLTSWPGVTCLDGLPDGAQCGLPLSNDSMANSRDRLNELACNTERVIQHVQLMIQDAIDLQGTPIPIEQIIDIMDDMHCNRKAYGWKLYPGAFNGFFMNSARARRVIEHGIEMGVPRFCVHKGLPIGSFFKPEENYPSDIGIVAKDYPEATFFIYHSAICAGVPSCDLAPPEGPYDETSQFPLGTNALIRSLLDNGIEPNQNVYAEIGSAINRVDSDPTVAAHFFGKLMKYVGTDNVVWGTDCVIYGSPQPFIQWFRALEIPQSMQEQYDYPPLNAENKAKILGLNAARVYGIDVERTRCQVDSCQTAMLRRQLDEELGPNRWMFRKPKGPKTWDEFETHSLRARASGQPG